MRFLTAILALLSAVAALADVTYTVTPDVQNRKLKVSVSFPANTPTVDVQLPRWAPGSYRLFSPGVQNLTARSVNTPLHVETIDETTWRINMVGNRSATVEYQTSIRLSDNAIHYTGPHNYVYLVGRKNEDCKLRITGMPDGWRAINGLDEDGPGWRAPDYDVLADNPVTLGDYILDTYSVGGKTHSIVLYGAGRNLVDRTKLKKYCQDITITQTAFFGDIPYNKYVWHFNVNTGLDGAGGLEHLSSTSISLAAGVGPRVVSVLSHEFFHLWNVKRIRSKPLGPFDYQNLPKTGALWWLEGVTDYYASIFLQRYNILPQSEFYADIVGNFRGYDSHAQKSNISPHESSMRVGETNNGRGNSSGYLISYYTMGWLSGLCLDIEIRRLTDNRHSLDHVMRALYAISGNGKPGFEEDEIRRQCIRFGGSEMGPFYDRVVHTNGGIPVRESLTKLGLQIEEIDERYKDVGLQWQGAEGAIEIRRDAGELKRGDLIVAIGGVPLRDLNSVQAAQKAQQLFDQAPASVPLKLDIRSDEEQSVTIVPELKLRKAHRVTKVQTATTEQVVMREAMLKVLPIPRE
jgi:predicted metalloprotease with PDZ domain